MGGVMSVERDDEHFCESPSCAVKVGCVAYQYDSAANGYWTTEEERRERTAWAIEDARRAGEDADLGPGEIPPPL
jgi:hypothetical protein